MATSPVSPGQVVIALKENGKVIGSQTNFMVNVDRRKLPVLALGRTEPLGYGRGFRIISGIIDYVIIDKDLLMEILEDMSLDKIGEIYAMSDQEYQDWNPIENTIVKKITNSEDNDSGEKKTFQDMEGVNIYKMTPYLLDMLPPLDIIVYGADETGQISGMIIYGLEFTSSSLVATVNDVALAQRAEWVAKSMTPWMPQG